MFTTLFATSTQQLRQYDDGSKIGYLMDYKGKWQKDGYHHCSVSLCSTQASFFIGDNKCCFKHSQLIIINTCRLIGEEVLVDITAKKKFNTALEPLCSHKYCLRLLPRYINILDKTKRLDKTRG
jgi:hypothetical protein